MNFHMSDQDERHMSAIYDQTTSSVFHVDSKLYVTDSQMDEADAMLLEMERSVAGKNWALEENVGSSLYNLDCTVGQASGIWDPHPLLTHPNDKGSSWSADMKMFREYIMLPTKPETISPAVFRLEPQSYPPHPEDTRGLQQSTPPRSQATTIAPKRSQFCDDTIEVARKKQRTTQVEKDLPKFRDYQEQQWQEQYQGLLEFKTKYGHCCVPNTYEPNTILGRWVKRQRYQYKLRQAGQQSTLVASRVQALEDVGFVWDSHSALWEERLNELKNYRQANGHCNVPSTYPKNKPLSTWVKCQRRQYRLTGTGKKSNLTQERIAALDDLGFVWDGRTIGSNARKHDVVEKTRPRRTCLSRAAIASDEFDFDW